MLRTYTSHPKPSNVSFLLRESPCNQPCFMLTRLIESTLLLSSDRCKRGSFSARQHPSVFSYSHIPLQTAHPRIKSVFDEYSGPATFSKGTFTSSQLTMSEYKSDLTATTWPSSPHVLHPASPASSPQFPSQAHTTHTQPKQKKNNLPFTS
jgi:hypothetical protein